VSAFKEQVARDRKDVFINADEFGSAHTIDGIPVDMVIDNDELRQRGDRSGLDLGALLFFARVEDMPWKPSVDRELLFDGKYMYVRTFNEDDGVYEITLAQNRSA